jgi:3-oxoacyl-[acyl-carrier-protein] synthase II
LAVRDQVSPFTLNLAQTDAQAEGLNFVKTQPQQLPIDYAISNGFGFGGVNASVIIKRYA